jgi:T-complex protein 1 subunit gamma
VLLRGGSKDVLNEVERNLQDAMQVVRNVVLEPRLLPGGGATEMAVANAIRRRLPEVEGVKKFACEAVANALEVIPRTLAQNCGANVVRAITELRAKHTSTTDGNLWSINGVTGELVESERLGVWEPYAVKVQTLKTSIESACMILRIDDIVSGMKKKQPGSA